MKKIVVFLLGVFLLASCSQSPQERAEAAIQKSIKAAGLAYTPISFSQLDTISLDTDEDYRMAKDSLFYYKSKLTEKSDQFQLSAFQNGAKRMKVKIEYLESLYKVVKYKIHHTYKTEAGEQEKEFYLDNQFRLVDKK